MDDTLPAGWAVSTIGDVCDPVSKRGPNGDVPTFQYIDLGSIDNKTKTIVKASLLDVADAPSRAKQIVQAGDVLFSNVRVYLENIAPVPDDLDGEVASTAFCVLRPATGVAPRYLYHFATSRPFIRDVDSLQRGNSPPSVQDSDVKTQPFPVAPTREQVRIASKIDELFSRIDEGEQALQRVQKLVERYRQSVLKAAVTGELTRDWRAARKRAGEPVESGEALLARILKARRAAWEAGELAKLKAKGKPPTDDRWKQKYKEPTSPDTAGLPVLPKGWVWTSIGEMKSFSLYGPRFSSEDYAVDGYSVLRTSDINASGRVNLATTPKLRLSCEEYAKYKVEKGDLLVTRTGSLGTLALYDDDVEAIPGAYLIQFRIPAPPTTCWYLFQFLRSPTGQRNLLEGGAGVGRPNLNAPHIESIPVPLPPLDEQAEIIRCIDDASVLCEKRLAGSVDVGRRSAALRQSILKAAFSGQLVPQDPHDEPASKLLERIAAEQAATIEHPRRRAKRTTVNRG